MRSIPLQYRLFGGSLRMEDLDARLGGFDAWHTLRSQIEPGDRIYPFAIRPATLAMRLGYVIARNGQPMGGVVLLSS